MLYSVHCFDCESSYVQSSRRNPQITKPDACGACGSYRVGVLEEENKAPMTTITLPCHGIIIKLDGAEEADGGTRYDGGTIQSALTADGNKLDIECVHTLESMILAHACAGVAVESPAYLEGIETAVDALFNRCL